jgi:outer membrane protein
MKRFTRVFALCLSSLLVASGGLSAQESVAEAFPVLTLEEAISIAQANNRNIKNAVLAASIAADQIAAARTKRYPAIDLYGLGSQLLTPLDFSFARGTFGTYPGIGPIPATNTSIHTPLRPTFFGVVQLKQPLSQQHKIGLNLRLGDLNKTLSDEKLRAEKQSVANQVKQAYYGLLRTRSALEVSDENLKLDQELARITKQNVEQKTALKADAMDIDAKIAQEEYNHQVLSDALATKKEQLNELLGRDLRTAFTVPQTPAALPNEIDLEAARGKALAQRPELRESRLAVKQAELNRRITKADYIPDVTFAVSDLSLASVNSLLPGNVASVGLLVTWSPLDWGRRKSELSQATKQIEQSKNSVNELEAQILVEVADKFRKLEQARALIRASDLGLSSARERQRVAMNQYEQKAALMTDVLQQEAAVQNATDQYQRALLAFWTAKADFEESVGED